MRIAVVSWNGRRVGGLGTYLSAIIPELIASGHEVAFWYELDEPASREKVVSSDAIVSWCAAEIGVQQALAALRDWRPDIIYSHKLESPEIEAALLEIAPAVFFAHDYYGTCISGLKAFKFPVVTPCSRRFGWQCLLHYFPHRCGGRNPITMVKLYRLQSKRLELLKQYDAIVTHSDHMLLEYLNHGLSAEHGYSFPYYVPQHHAEGDERDQHQGAANPDSSFSGVAAPNSDETPFAPNTRPYWRLLFSGRMELLKGAHVFLGALPQVAQSLDRPLQVTLAGDGTERKRLEAQASRIRRSNPDLEIEFTGWMDHTRMESMLGECDLIVVPSLWPEPFGLVGPEAGQHAVPVAAFAVGGIRDWLKDGFNGHLAPGNPPSAGGLAEAVIHCLKDPAHHARLRSGAVVISRRFSLKNHLSALERVFDDVLARRAAGASR